MDVLQSLRESVEQNVGLINEGFQEVLARLGSKEKQLRAVQKSVTQSSKELDLRRESIEEWSKQVAMKEEEMKELQLFQENRLQELEQGKKELGLMLEDVKIREDKLQFQEKVIEGVFEKIELERRNLETIQKCIDGKFEDLRNERDLGKKSEKSKVEIELRENMLDAREEMLAAKEKELNAMERLLDLKTGDLRNQNRKRGRGRDTDEEFIHEVNDGKVNSSSEEKRAKTIVISDSSESGSSSGKSCPENSLQNDSSESESESYDNKLSPENSLKSDSSKSESYDNKLSPKISSSSGKNHEYPATEFYDFEKIRSKSSSMSGLWAIYDEVDTMPRRYVEIVSKKGKQKGKERIAWLEDGRKYKDTLPVVCGKFKRGKCEDFSDELKFSHPIRCERNGWAAGSYVIYPKRGEIWAIYEDWPKQKTYKIVEVLSDFVANAGVRVVYLEKISGYVSLFQRAAVTNSVFKIRSMSMRRFSHQIPSYQINGTEGKGAPKGSFELDTAALPIGLIDTSYSDKGEVNNSQRK